MVCARLGDDIPQLPSGCRKGMMTENDNIYALFMYDDLALCTFSEKKPITSIWKFLPLFQCQYIRLNPAATSCNYLLALATNPL